MKYFIFCLALVFCAGSAFAIPGKDYEDLLKTWPVLARADRDLAAWKENTGHLAKKYKQYILKEQRDWLKYGCDADARGFRWAGYEWRCSYLISILHRIADVRLFGYSAGLSEEDKNAGRVRADDFYYEESDVPPECERN